MKLALTSPNKDNYFNNPWVTFSNLQHAACYLEPTAGDRFFTVGMYMWLTGQLMSSTGPQCPITGNMEIACQLVKAGILEYPTKNNYFPLGDAGMPANYGGYLTPIAEDFDYLNLNFQKWLSRMEGILAYEEKLGLKQRGVNSSSTVQPLADGSWNVTMAYDKDFEDKMAAPGSIVFSYQTIINLVIKNKGLNFNLDLENMWSDLCNNILPGIATESGFKATFFDICTNAVLMQDSYFTALCGIGWLVHGGICELITKIANSWSFVGESEPSGNTYYDAHYAFKIDPSSGEVQNWNDLSYNYNQPWYYPGNNDISLSSHPIVATGFPWILSTNIDPLSGGTVATGPVMYLHPPELWSKYWYNFVYSTYRGPAQGGAAFTMHGMTYAAGSGPYSCQAKLAENNPWLEPILNCTQLLDPTRYGCSFTFDPSANDILYNRFNTMMNKISDTSFGAVPTGNDNEFNDNPIYVGRELVDTKWSVWNSFQNTVNIQNNFLRLINIGLSNYNISLLLNDISLSTTAVPIDVSYAGVYQGYNLENSSNLISIDISTNGSITFDPSNTGYSGFVIGKAINENDGYLYLIVDGSGGWLADHYYNQPGVGTTVLESIEKWYNIYVINTSNYKLQRFQILQNPVMAMEWFTPEYFYNTKTLTNIDGTIDIITAKSNTTVPWDLSTNLI